MAMATALSLSASFSLLSLSSSSSSMGKSGSHFFTGQASPSLLRLSCKPVIAPVSRCRVICAATPKKVDSAVKRARQAVKKRLNNKSRKSEIFTRMKKVFAAIDGLKKQSEASPDDILPVEKLIAEAYSVIDKAAKVGTIHHNTAARRKSRLARAKKAASLQLGFYTPTAA